MTPEGRPEGAHERHPDSLSGAPDAFPARSEEEIVGVVLAGGLSSRLGSDKTRLRLAGGESADLLARAVRLLREVCGRAVVIGREQPGYDCYPDILPGRGPVGGIATALERARCACLVLSCDLPFMERRILERLIAAYRQRPVAALSTAYRQEETGHIEALVAVYAADTLPLFRASAEAGLLKISLIVPRERQHFLPYSVEEALPFFNINYPADLLVARRVLGMLGRERE